MKELSTEEKAKRYDKAIEKAEKWHNAPNVDKIPTFGNRIIEDIFPELKESEDGMIREALIEHFSWNTKQILNGFSNKKILAWLEKQNNADKVKQQQTIEIPFGAKDSELQEATYYIPEEYHAEINGNEVIIKKGEQKTTWKPTEKQMDKPLFTYDDILALQCCMETSKKVQEDKELYEQLQSLHDRLHDAYWLEKQGEQKSVDKVAPKFKVGDWVVYNRNDHSREVIQIYDIRDNRYYFNDNIHFSWSVKECDEKSHLWTIEDAKEGDVLDANGAPFIYKKHDKDCVYFYCGVNLAGEFIEANGIDIWNNNYKVYPATKEQYDLLFQKMKEVGYEWNKDKKELIKL